MKVEEFVKTLGEGDLARIFDHDDLRFNVGKFIADYGIPAGNQFLLCLAAQCGCSRFVHFKIQRASLITKANGELHYRYRLQSTFAWPKDNNECGKVFLPQSWSTVPVVALKVAYTHKVLDKAFAAYTQEPQDVPGH
jgi:hypothetical protein